MFKCFISFLVCFFCTTVQATTPEQDAAIRGGLIAIDRQMQSAFEDRDQEQFTIAWNSLNSMDAYVQDSAMISIFKGVWFARTGNFTMAQQYIDKCNEIDLRLKINEHKLTRGSVDLFIEALHRVTVYKANVKPVKDYVDPRYADYDLARYVARVVTEEATGNYKLAPQIGPVNPVYESEFPVGMDDPILENINIDHVKYTYLFGVFAGLMYILYTNWQAIKNYWRRK